uniref:At2g35280-like TPR domain-containing protein n=1 Tax=Lactuca sativa TaxID=4236 RepID=A0A9R1WNN5_LACSA|nr:hypothetical protein LSAT_V11C100027170 [Lactuca sativa]
MAASYSSKTTRKKDNCFAIALDRKNSNNGWGKITNQCFEVPVSMVYITSIILVYIVNIVFNRWILLIFVNYSCKFFRDSVTSYAIYKTINTNQLRFRPFSVHTYEVLSRCRKLNNPHVLFDDRMAKYFSFREEIVGKQLHQDAADKGQLDVIFVLGMMLMAEGNERKQEALIMLNNTYINTRRCWNRIHTCYKVQSHLVRRSKQIQFHGLHKRCAKHPSVSCYGTTFMYQYIWLFNCDICLWDACLVKFARMFDIILE